jgi:hypothetical protein
LQWLYSYFNPATVRNMPPQCFIIVSKTGALGLGEFPYPAWHKKEREDILSNVGIKVEYGEMLEEARSRGTYLTVSDKEYSEIIRIYVEEGLGYAAIAERLHRSSRTPHEHITAHNKAIERSGFCALCKRVKGRHLNALATRGSLNK